MYTVYIILRQNFSDKKKSFAISEKTLAETVHYIPKVLRKGNPFHGPFAQLSYIYAHITEVKEPTNLLPIIPLQPFPVLKWPIDIPTCGVSS